MDGFSLQADLDVSGAAECGAQLLSWVESAGPGASLELSHAAPTQVALQLLVAAARTLEASAANPVYGPNAALWLQLERSDKGQPDGQDHSDH